MNKLVKDQFNLILNFVKETLNGLEEIEKTRETTQIPIDTFLDALNTCLVNASIMYYSVEFMKKIDESIEKTEKTKNDEELLPYV